MFRCKKFLKCSYKPGIVHFWWLICLRAKIGKSAIIYQFSLSPFSSIFYLLLSLSSIYYSMRVLQQVYISLSIIRNPQGKSSLFFMVREQLIFHFFFFLNKVSLWSPKCSEIFLKRKRNMAQDTKYEKYI